MSKGINYIHAEQADLDAGKRKSHKIASDIARDIVAPIMPNDDYAAIEPPQVVTTTVTHDTPKVRTFETGATRDNDESKHDFDGFLSPHVLDAFGAYMHKHRHQADGKLRDSDNWQKGIPRTQYRKSAWRHFLAWWKKHRNGEDTTEEGCAILFNIMGDLHEALKPKSPPAHTT